MIKTPEQAISATGATTTPVPGPAAPQSGAVTAESDERPVNLARRFFNIKTGLSFLLGITILVTLFRVTTIHPSEIWQQLQQVDGRVYSLAVLSYVLTFPFRGVRWQRLLDNVGIRLPALPLTEVIFISWFVNSVLPGKVGDIYRGYLLRREYGLSLSRTIGTVVAERVVDLAGLITLLGVTGYFVLRNRVSPAMDQMLHLGWVALGLLLVGMIVAHRYGERIMTVFPETVQSIYRRFAHGTFSSLKNLPLLACLTILAWAAEAGRLYFVMQALNVSLGPLVALFTVAAVSLALIVPTPGGLGGVEAAFALVLTGFGVPVPLALAVALLDRLISFYSLVVCGFPAFLLTKRGR
jgi:uncharacterized protein (TIRG00374 family)